MRRASRARAFAFALRFECAFGCAFGCAVACAGTAAAQAPADKAAARKLFDDGKTKRDRGDREGSLEAFTQADAIMMVPTTRLAVARALVALDRLVAARESAASVEKMPAVGKESQPFIDARSAAAELVKELDERIPYANFVLAEHVGAKAEPVTIVVDGLALSGDGLGLRRLDPGKHTVVATIAGHQSTMEILLAEKESRTVAIGGESPAPAPKPKPEARSPIARPLLWGGIGLAVVGAGLGTVAGVISMGKTSDLDGQCQGGRCPPAAHDTFDSAHSWATISTIGFIGAGVGVVAAGVGLLLDSRSRRQSTQATGARATMTLGGAGFEGTF